MRRTLALAALLIGSAHAADLPGSTDHPLLRRFDGADLVGYEQQAFGRADWPTSARIKDWDHLQDVQAFEGRVTRLVYVTPLGKTPLEVFRNHQQALQSGGFQTLWSCDSQCDNVYWRWYRQLKPQESMAFLDGHMEAPKGGRYHLARPVGGEDVRLWVGKQQRADGGVVTVQLITSVAVSRLTERAATWIQILEPAAMQTGQVLVRANALQAAISEQGKAVLYGLLFDTGKTELKPESQDQLEQIRALLKDQPKLKLLVVGHTDTVGQQDANLTLSQGRAQAVVAALVKSGIASERLQARGVGYYAPVAPNANEEGRARNRRVELVPL